MHAPATSRTVRHLRNLLTALSAAVLAAACSGTGVLRQRLAPRTPHERYADALRDAGLDRTGLGQAWLGAAEVAVRRPATVPLPLREAGTFAAGEARATAWRLTPRRGERVRVTVSARGADAGVPAPVGAPAAALGAPPRLFLDLYRVSAVLGGDTAVAPERIASADSAVAGALALDFVADGEDAAYIVRLQPELLRAVAWTLTAEVGPSLATFPVAGRSARSVQSFWGADRDAGARRHEGIDIFAPRGTPVVAATDGVVRSAGENRLGGRVVFLYDPAGGQSLYYAHLDSQTVAGGERVQAGDTLGYVGNTGNARTTAPHLHFGIYRRGEGAVNPFPYVDDQHPRPAALLARDSAATGRRARATSAATLRAGPGSRTATLARVAAATPLVVEGASAVRDGEGWLRVRLPDGTAGYLPASTVRAEAAGD